MLVELGGHLINLSLVVRFETVDDATGRERHRVHFVGGDTMLIFATHEQIARHCGAVIPSPLNFRAVELHRNDWDNSPPGFDISAVVAFRITGSIDTPAIPVTARGVLSEEWAIIDPDGKVHANDDRSFESLADYKASIIDAAWKAKGEKVGG